VAILELLQPNVARSIAVRKVYHVLGASAASRRRIGWRGVELSDSRLGGGSNHSHLWSRPSCPGPSLEILTPPRSWSYFTHWNQRNCAWRQPQVLFPAGKPTKMRNSSGYRKRLASPCWRA